MTRSAQRIWIELRQARVDALAADLPAMAWKRLSCGGGTKGERIYDCSFVTFPFQPDDHRNNDIWIRRSINDSREQANYLCGFNPGTTFEELIRVAGCCWAIEPGFEQAKQEVGLDDYEVRSRDGWHRHITLSFFCARASRSGVRRRSRAAPKKRQTPCELIPPTLPEVRRLLIRVASGAPAGREFCMEWSQWRRRHQAGAVQAHYRGRGHPFTETQL